jgi:prevent-host-death family protein
MKRVVSITAPRGSLAEVVRRVHRDDSHIVLRRGQPVFHVVPVSGW